MIKKISKHKYAVSLACIIFSILVFFYPFFLQGKLPIPADTIVGLYHPFRDLYADTNPNGIAYKNYLITDPVRQQYVWKELAIDIYRQGQLPIWNLYEMSGKPLLANFQTGAFYPLNAILLLNPFSLSWSVFILMQLILGGMFMFLYLKSLNLSPPAIVLGTTSWIFSGFAIAWLEWGNIGHTALWLPLILVAVNKFLISRSKKEEIIWFFVLLFSLCSSFFAGHLQTFFYLAIFVGIYTLALWIVNGRKISKFFPILTVLVLFITITSIQWVPTLQYIDLSGRAEDLPSSNPGWFIPLQNLAQFIAPDYLGNPATLNYYGIFNYGEFVGYIGIGGLLFSTYAILFRHDKKTIFYGVVLLASFIMVLQNPISLMPFVLKMPFLSTAQPTRLLVIICFSLSVLASLGFDAFLKKKSKTLLPIGIVGIVLLLLWGCVYFLPTIYPSANDIAVSKSNLRLPTVLYIAISLFAVLYTRFKKRFANLMVALIILISIFDLLRFGWKYTPFVNSEFLFPETKITKFLDNDNSLYRLAATDDRLLIPNFSTAYSIQSIEGYDPLYVNNYAKFIAANERDNHSVVGPFGFNRTIRPRNFNSDVYDFLNVKYLLSLDEIDNPKYELILEEGMTKLYENKNVFPRAYFVQKVHEVQNAQEAADLIHSIDIKNEAVIYGDESVKDYSLGSAKVVTYLPNKVEIQTENQKEGFLVVSDVYYPSFRATIDGKDAEIIPVNIAFRGIKVPAGEHRVVFSSSLF